MFIISAINIIKRKNRGDFLHGYDRVETGKRIQEIRQKRFMTQEALAEKADIYSAQQMSNIERGTAGLSLDRFTDICTVLEVSSDYLLFGISAFSTKTILSKYIDKMTTEQQRILIDFVKSYANTCGINEL